MLTPNPKFRLWLTTEQHSMFPTILLQQSLKVTIESPPGMKQNLLRTYESWTSEFLNTKSPKLSQILFVLAWFHALVQERRSYIPQGWTKFYEFTTSDLRSAADVIENACDQDGNPDWETIYGLLENAIYGGRVDDDYDLRVLKTYLREFFSDDVLTNARGVSYVSPLAITFSQMCLD